MFFKIYLVILATTVLSGGEERDSLGLAERLERLEKRVLAQEERITSLLSQPYCYTCAYQADYPTPCP